MAPIRLDYDVAADAVYMYLIHPLARGDCARTHVVEDEGILLDFSSKGVLLGIEVLNARKRLPADLIGHATPVSGPRLSRLR